jgi:ornithine carbamoyltransferase
MTKYALTMHKYESQYNAPSRTSTPLLARHAPKPAAMPIPRLENRYFLTGEELNTATLLELIDLAALLKAERRFGKRRQDCAGKTLALMFEKPSLRTHMSFSLAMQELGGQTVESFTINRKHEEPEDVARVVASYCDAIMLRTHEHGILERMAQVSKAAIINGLSDSHHPCQVLADILTLKENFGDLKGLQFCYIGDGNNMLHSLLLLLPKLGVHVSYACPNGFEPDAEILNRAKQIAENNGADIRGYNEPHYAARGAHALYTDVWTSMGFEDEQVKRESAFKDFQINASLFRLASTEAVVMHCLPMEKGKEITHEMAEHSRSVIFQQAENRLHAQKALLLMMLGK